MATHAIRREFDWVMGDRPHRRSTLRLISQAIRQGWLDGPANASRRASLRASLARIAPKRHEDREALALCDVFLDMDRQDVKVRAAALKAISAAIKASRSQQWEDSARTSAPLPP